MKGKPLFRHLDLFSGIGGFAYAVDQVWENAEHIFCDNDKFCQRVLKKHWPNSKIYGDIKEFKPRGITVDLLTGGFPCQDISNARTWTTQDQFIEQGIKGKRSGLWSEMCRIISQTHPKFVVAENVEALCNKGLQIVLQDLYEVGYDAEWDIISAAYVGAPHQRKRLWIVAYPICLGRKQKSIVFGEIFSKKIRQTSWRESGGTICQETGKKIIPPPLGVDDGLPAGLDKRERIKSLGNSIVPQVAIEILKAIKSQNSFNS